MINSDNYHCLVCNSAAINHVSVYPGLFLSCTELLKCQNCGLVFASKLPDQGELDEYYASGMYFEKVSDPFSTEFELFSHKLARSRLRLLRKKVHLLQGDLNVIDIGAGNARFGIALKEIWPSAVYDTVEPDIAVSNQYGDWVRRSYQDIKDVHNSGYDLAVMNQVMEHVSDPLGFLGSICNLIRPKGYVYIDVPYLDYLFKPNVEPHLLFWNEKSMKVLLETIGFQVVFCDTAGMQHARARMFFNNPTLLEKMWNPWTYAVKANSLIKKLGSPAVIDTFGQFQADTYGGNRQWLRCIAQRME